MKILIDENISSRLVFHIQLAFPEVEHVKTLGLLTANDFSIFMFARQNGYDAVRVKRQQYPSVKNHKKSTKSV